MDSLLVGLLSPDNDQRSAAEVCKDTQHACDTNAPRPILRPFAWPIHHGRSSHFLTRPGTQHWAAS